MTSRTWRDADQVLATATGPLTREQQKLSELAGKTLPDWTPSIVAAAMLKLAFAKDLDLPLAHPISDELKEWIQTLRRPADPVMSPDTDEEAKAWIKYLYLLRRRESLRELQLNEGDIVETSDGVLAEVSSIGDSGRVFFKGVSGCGAWPDLVTVVARRDDGSPSATEAKQQARNAAESRKPASSWSMAKQHDLIEFAVADSVSESDIARLETIIETAEDERPIQKHLHEHPHLLTALLRGTERYCLPQKRLGSEYVPDFIIGDVDSLGIHWFLVELETPRSGMYLKDGETLSKHTRKGVDQIVNWRNWLSSNLPYARQPRRAGGLGLFDIKEKTRALVLVGKRFQLTQAKNDANRYELRQSNDIEIHSYDWLVDSLRGAIQFVGPPAGNPHLIPR